MSDILHGVDFFHEGHFSKGGGRYDLGTLLSESLKLPATFYPTLKKSYELLGWAISGLQK
jgi:hypothetical protein